MKITLLRHAEVIEKYQGKYNGHIDIPLSPNGLMQAKKLSTEFQDTQFDKVYCSDLLRAQQTLNALQLNTQVIFTKKLREKSWGKHEGKSFDEIRKEEGIEYKNFEQWLQALDGENILEYEKHIKNYFFHTIFQQEAQNILVVTHSGVIKILLKILNNLSLEEAFSLKLEYASFVVLDTSGYNNIN